MLFIGQNVTQNPPETLSVISPKELFEMIAVPGVTLENEIEVLRKMRQIDEKVYKRRKTFLPYFIGSTFEGNKRNTQSFLRIGAFVLDFDNCLNGQDAEVLKGRIFEDETVMMTFLSPGANGIKVVFVLESPITNTKVFTDFYKRFALQFARKFGLEAFTDTVTCDVTRISFLSVDRLCLFRPEPVFVQWKAYTEGLNLAEVLPLPETFVQVLPSDSPFVDEPDSIHEETYKQILEKLNPKTPKRKRKYYVPAELDTITEGIYQAVKEYEIGVKEVEDIQYGRRWTFVLGNSTAEINIFYGKNGFSVVKTTKSGTDPDLCEVVFRIITNLIYT